MSERLSDIEARISTVHQLEAVITAMRSVAASRAREARAQLDGIRAYADAVAGAIGDALAFLGEPERREPSRSHAAGRAVIAICAEQGFAGAFSERVLDAARELAGPKGASRSELLLIGDRGMMVAAERELSVDWSAPMIAHVGEAEALASRIVDALYERLDAGAISEVSVVHVVPAPSATLEIVRKTLVPFDFGRFPLPGTAVPPLLTLPPQLLLARLVEEYVFSELFEAVVLSFAAENEARMRAMIAARGNVDKTLGELVANARRSRQEQITSEIIELASGGEASRAARRRVRSGLSRPSHPSGR